MGLKMKLPSCSHQSQSATSPFNKAAPWRKCATLYVNTVSALRACMVIRDYSSLSGLLPLSDELLSLAPCLAPPRLCTQASGCLRDHARSHTDRLALADMFFGEDELQIDAVLLTANMTSPVSSVFPNRLTRNFRLVCRPHGVA